MPLGPRRPPVTWFTTGGRRVPLIGQAPKPRQVLCAGMWIMAASSAKSRHFARPPVPRSCRRPASRVRSRVGADRVPAFDGAGWKSNRPCGGAVAEAGPFPAQPPGVTSRLTGRAPGSNSARGAEMPAPALRAQWRAGSTSRGYRAKTTCARRARRSRSRRRRSVGSRSPPAPGEASSRAGGGMIMRPARAAAQQPPTREIADEGQQGTQ